MEEKDEVRKSSRNLKKTEKGKSFGLSHNEVSQSKTSINKSESCFQYLTYGGYLQDLGMKRKLMEGKRKKITVSGAEKLDGIEKTNYRLNFIHEKHTGVPVLSEEDEAELVKNILERLKMNMPMDNMEIRETARKYSLNNTINFKKYNNEIPSKTWLSEFKKKYKPLFWGDMMTIQLQLLENDNEQDDLLISQSHQEDYEMKQIITSKGLDKNICRFCMKQIKVIKNRKIPENFFDEFARLTGFELDNDSKYPEIICETCQQKFSSSVEFLDSIIECQKVMQNLVEENEEKSQIYEEIEVYENKLTNEQNEDSELYDCLIEYLDEAKDQFEMLEDTEIIEEKPENNQSLKESKAKFIQETRQQLKNINPKLREVMDSYMEVKFSCDLCGHGMRTKGGLRCHMANKHTKKYKKDSYPCKLCPEVFTSYWKYSDHTHKVHLTGDYKCNECEEIFKDRISLRNHQSKTHVAKVNCDACGKLFLPQQLSRHQRNVHNRCECQYCGREFNSKTVLRTHILGVHEQDEQTCEICGGTFANKIRLSKHIKRQHSVDRLKCPVRNCEYTSTRKVYVKLHLDHHRDIDQNEKDRLWIELKQIKGFWT